MFLYIILTFPAMLQHVPWYDEAHAYILASAMNTGNWLDMVRTEGHPLLWFLLLMPFAKLHWNYPYPMLLINYVFCLASVFMVWKKSGFNVLLKIAVTFAGVFLFYFPIVARGYTVGIFFLFCLASMYKDKLNHPILYPALIFLTFNTNIICAIGAAWFGLSFLFNMIKSNADISKKIVSAVIITAAVAVVFLPFVKTFGTAASVEDSAKQLNNFIAFFSAYYYLRAIIYSIILIMTFWKFYKLPEISFLLFTHGLLICLFAGFYPGYPHHFIFYFIYFVIFIWLYNNKYPNSEVSELKPYFPVIYSIIIAVLLFLPVKNDMYYAYVGDNYKMDKLAQLLNTDSEIQNSNLYVGERESLIQPYIKNGIHLYSICNLEEIKWNTFYNRKCTDLNGLMEKISNEKTTALLLTKDNLFVNIPYYKWGDYYLFKFTNDLWE